MDDTKQLNIKTGCGAPQGTVLGPTSFLVAECTVHNTLV